MYSILYLLINVVYCVKEKLCVNCKHFIPPSFILPNPDFSKCKKYQYIVEDKSVKEYKTEFDTRFPTNKDLIRFLITGNKRNEIKKDKEINYYYCSTARDCPNMCSIYGKDFEDKCE